MTTEQRLIDVEIPAEYVALCEGWAGDTSCMLRAIESMGTLTLGTRRPYSEDVNRHLTDQEWHVSLWARLSADVASCARMAEKSEAEGMAEQAAALRQFETFADVTAAMLRVEYGLTDSDAV